jgi:hypothetical protein
MLTDIMIHVKVFFEEPQLFGRNCCPMFQGERSCRGVTVLYGQDIPVAMQPVAMLQAAIFPDNVNERVRLKIPAASCRESSTVRKFAIFRYAR